MGEYYGYGFSSATQRKQELERIKKLEAARLEALKQDQRQEIISTMKPTISCINGAIDNVKDDLKDIYNILNNRIHQLEENELHARICQLEETAAVRSGLSNRPHKKLRITISA